MSQNGTQAADQPATFEQWRELAERDLGGPWERKLVTRLLDGVDLRALQHAGDWPNEHDPAGRPGQLPFTRGSRATPSARWDVRQQQFAATAAELAHDIADDLCRGATSVAVPLDAAARAGTEPDSHDAHPLVGVDGAAVYTATMLAAVLAGPVPSAAESQPSPAERARAVRLRGGAAFLPAAALTLVVWRQHGVDPAGLPADHDAFAADPLSTLALEGRLPLPVEAAYDQLAALARWTVAHAPQASSIRVSTLPYHDAGATETQDLAAALATGVAYLRALTARGLDVAAAAGQIAFEVRVGADLFLALAKLRALRRLWGRVLEACGRAAGPGARIHAVTAWRTMAQRDPWANLLRATAGAVSAALGGTASLTVLPFDAALGQPDSFGRRLARNTQLVLLEEAQLARVADPAGGSWSLEGLTEDLAQEAWGEFQAIEARGGMLAVLADGSWHRSVDEAHQVRMKEVATRELPIVGVSQFAQAAETPAETHKLAEPQAVHAEALREWREARDARDTAAVQAALTRLAAAVEQEPPGPGWVEAATAAAAAGASVAEMARHLGFAPLGTHGAAVTTIPQAFAPRRLAEPFEALRDAADEYAETHQGERPAVFLAALGRPPQHGARLAFADGVAQAGGLATVAEEDADSVEAYAEAWRDSGAPLAVVCGSDEAYAQWLPRLAAALKQAGCAWLVVAGRPAAAEAEWRAAGVDQYIHQGCDVLATLRQWHAKIGL